MTVEDVIKLLRKHPLEREVRIASFFFTGSSPIDSIYEDDDTGDVIIEEGDDGNL